MPAMSSEESDEQPHDQIMRRCADRRKISTETGVGSKRSRESLSEREESGEEGELPEDDDTPEDASVNEDEDIPELCAAEDGEEVSSEEEREERGEGGAKMRERGRGNKTGVSKARKRARKGKNGGLEAESALLPSPVGVEVVESIEARTEDIEVMSLTRGRRYFTADLQQGVRCYKCGVLGHMARNCSVERSRPCYICAQFGHESSSCPKQRCYKCGGTGHFARGCTRGGMERQLWMNGDGEPICLRCGSASCSAAGKGDYFRSEGGCSGKYTKQDLQWVRCLVCCQRGHLCCRQAPSTPAKPSCSMCGERGHTALDCPEHMLPHLRAERQEDERATTAIRDAITHRPSRDHHHNSHAYDSRTRVPAEEERWRPWKHQKHGRWGDEKPDYSGYDLGYDYRDEEEELVLRQGWARRHYGHHHSSDGHWQPSSKHSDGQSSQPRAWQGAHPQHRRGGGSEGGGGSKHFRSMQRYGSSSGAGGRDRPHGYRGGRHSGQKYRGGWSTQ